MAIFRRTGAPYRALEGCDREAFEHGPDHSVIRDRILHDHRQDGTAVLPTAGIILAAILTDSGEGSGGGTGAGMPARRGPEPASPTRLLLREEARSRARTSQTARATGPSWSCTGTAWGTPRWTGAQPIDSFRQGHRRVSGGRHP